MNQKTLKALKGSIVKWEKIIAGTGKDHGWQNCPLCKLFYKLYDCEGCPVKERNGIGGCSGTPYKKWVKHCDAIHESFLDGSPIVQCKICERHAKAEVEFLKSLLPGGIK